MLVPLTEINNCYILQKQIGHDSCTEHWLASAIFSPHKFLIRFVKEDLATPVSLESYRLESMRYYTFEGSAFSDFIEIEYFNQRLFISSEYHGEETLTESLLNDRARDPDLSCLAILNLAGGIDRIHERQIIFGSLTPENIEIVSGGRSGYDFRLRTPGYFSLYAALSASVAGSGLYHAFLAPESRHGTKAGRTADIYSLGITLVWLLTGPLPVQDQSFPSNLPEEFRKRQIPEALSRIINKSIQQDPKKRYPNCTDFIEEVNAYLKISQKAKEAESTPPASILSTNEPSAPPVLHVVLPEASPRPDVLKYFQEISADYFSAPGKDSARAAQVGKPEQKPIPRTPAPLPQTRSNPNADYFTGMTAGNGKSTEAAILPQTPLISDQNPILALVDPEIPIDVQELPKDPELPSLIISLPSTKSPLIEPSISDSKAEKRKDAKTIDRHPDASTPKTAQSPAPSWKYRRVALDAIASRLLDSVRRARGSRGAVHYLGEPDSKETSSLIENLFADLQKESVFLDLGSFLRFGQAGVQDFLRALREALTKSLATEKTYSLSRFARMIDRLGARAFFGVKPLGTILYGKDDLGRELAETDWDSAIEAMTVFGRKKKPLVLVIRGGESFQPELTAFFNRAVPQLKSKPVCLFLFRKDFPAILRILGVADPHP